MNMADGEGMTQSVAAESQTEASSATFWDRYFAAESVADATERRSSPRLPYIPALDGLRAIAVLAVLVYHSGVRWLPGGFLGVEVFFVLSGYLITSLLVSEYRETGRIDLKSFWIRRARRLLPALFLLLLATLTYAVIFLPQQVTQLRSDAVAAALYVTNWWLIFDHKSYFEEMGRPSLLKHLWSLAVEEQFYLIWPPLFALGISRLRERKMILGVLGAAGLSTVLMAILFQPGVDPSRIYYGTDTRAAELLIGAALAFVWQPGSPRPFSDRWMTRTADWLGSGRRAQVAARSRGDDRVAGCRVGVLAVGRIRSDAVPRRLPAGRARDRRVDRHGGSSAIAPARARHGLRAATLGRPALVRDLSLALAGLYGHAARTRRVALRVAVVHRATGVDARSGRSLVPVRRDTVSQWPGWARVASLSPTALGATSRGSSRMARRQWGSCSFDRHSRCGRGTRAS